MVDKLLTKDYRQRPDIEQILMHPSMTGWIKKLNIDVPSAESLKIGPKKPKEARSVEPVSKLETKISPLRVKAK
jgi:hypothetical protein